MRDQSEGPVRLRRGTPVPLTPYVVIDAIAEGGMGELFEVLHVALDRRAALKVLHPRFAHRPDLAARMHAEARALASVRHPNVVDVFDYGELPDGRPYLLMELLRGHDLRTELTRLGVLAVPSALALVLQLCEALAATHARGLVHRDLKLENLFLCSDGTLRLLDFGLARDLSSDVRHTAQGLCVGTPRSMAPEQYEMQEPSERTDVYAAGLILFELVAGEGPFDRHVARPGALRDAHCFEAPAPPSLVAPQPIPASVDAVVLRALAKSPADRFPSARAMAAHITEVLGERRRSKRLPPAVDRARAPSTRPEGAPRPASYGPGTAAPAKTVQVHEIAAKAWSAGPPDPGVLERLGVLASVAVELAGAAMARVRPGRGIGQAGP